ncbi:MAG: acyl-CoA dehydrogenase family protein [Deltaproteobacteria bacterium]|nr:acyl-CoA dehydrogenase family protein [Deltaproteobacteria bacterium]
MGFELSDDQKALQETARKFARNEMWPKAPHHDKTSEFPHEIMKKAFEAGLMNLSIPQDLGGPGFAILDQCIITEEIAYGCVGMGTSMMANDLALTPIILAGTPEQKQRFVKPFAEKLKYASFGLTEPGHGSDAAGMETRIEKKGDHYLLNGSKCWITNGGVADQLTVFCTIDRKLGPKGICAIVVDKNMPGVSVGKHEDKMGQRASETVVLNFEDVKIPFDRLLGKEGEGFKIAMQTLDRTRPLVAISGVGVARAALEHAVKYSKERKQFGQPISGFQGIQFMLADMAADVEASRLLTWESAWMIDAGKPASMYSSFAKRVSTDTAMKVTTDAVQVFGGYGYVKEYPVEKLMRDAKLLQIYEGTNQIQRVVIARELLKQF